VLGDGSTWIWNTARELFPRATQILDRYHAKEALLDEAIAKPPVLKRIRPELRADPGPLLTIRRLRRKSGRRR